MRRPRAFLAAFVGAMLCFACSDGDGGRRDAEADAGPAEDAAAMDARAPEDGGQPIRDGGLVVHDGGGPIACNTTCACPQGLGCIEGTCRATGSPVWCCEKDGCPAGQPCLGAQDQPSFCEGEPETQDGGVRPDAGPGNVGGYCEVDQDCDQMLGLTCWTRDEPPFLWGYCTQTPCTEGTCPAGSACLQFNDPNGPILGCLQTCDVDGDCRSDAYCFPVAGAAFAGVCIPDCRDDIFDCAPRDGTQYCSPATGQCAATPTHDPNAAVGDPCVNSTECAVGDVCMGEIGWGLTGGMCTRVCSGLPEAIPCGPGQTCQSLAGVGFCFADCAAGACPDRPGAACGSLDPSWVTESCIPQ